MFIFAAGILGELTLIGLAFLVGVVIATLVVLRLKGERLFSGTIHVKKTPDKIIYSLELDHDPEDLEHMKTVSFKVHPAKNEEEKEE
jgi:hypothetical protein